MRVAVISDTHCGHLYGLTGPAWWSDCDTTEGTIQRAMWSWFAETTDKYRPIDSLICNGDMIDGKGARSGGTELITTDRKMQCDIAYEVIKAVDASTVHMIYGTPYHVGTDEDWEAVLADMADADISGHEWYEADGVVIDCKHKVGSSAIPHGRYTAPARAALWNQLWSERGLTPRADLLLRSHVHYHVFCGDGAKTVITTPCLQGKTKYGSRQCEGTIDIGFIIIDIDGGSYTWKAELMDMEPTAARAVPL